VADGAGVDGIILTERRSAPLSPVAVKAAPARPNICASRGSSNLVRALEELKRQNIWIIGLDERAHPTTTSSISPATASSFSDAKRWSPRLVRRTCDHLLRIPMAGGVSSLNVSAAGAVVLYEAARQRALR